MSQRWTLWLVVAASMGVLAGTARGWNREPGQYLGRYTNSRDLNGGLIDFAALNRTKYAGIGLRGVMKGDAPVHGVSLRGSEIVGYQGPRMTPAELRTGAWFVGATFEGTALAQPVAIAPSVEPGTVLTLTIEGVEQTVAHRQGWVPTTITTYLISAQGQWICGEARDRNGTMVPQRAIILEGAWNYLGDVEGGGSRLETPPGIVTLACLKAALGKCAADEDGNPNLFGYVPWGKRRILCDGSSCARFQDVDLRDAHQACTRMVRADYCGRGRSFTEDGTKIDVEDALGLNAFRVAGFEYEALWDDAGALALDCARKAKLWAKHELDGQSCPALDRVDTCDATKAESHAVLSGHAPQPPTTSPGEASWDVGRYHGILRNTHEPEPKHVQP